MAHHGRQETTALSWTTFCQRCPKVGAECREGDEVISHRNCISIHELTDNQTLNVSTYAQRRLESHQVTVVNVYQCSLSSCSGNNTCHDNRTGVLCHTCPEGSSMEANVCAKCESNPQLMRRWQVTLATISLIVYLSTLLDSNITISILLSKTQGQGRKVDGKMDGYYRQCQRLFAGYHHQNWASRFQNFHLVFPGYCRIRSLQSGLAAIDHERHVSLAGIVVCLVVYHLSISGFELSFLTRVCIRNSAEHVRTFRCDCVLSSSCGCCLPHVS